MARCKGESEGSGTCLISGIPTKFEPFRRISNNEEELVVD